ncbi:MAG: DUF192 domain-containing protein [Candidatus Wildermuthbacteria bacterium]|nr:DUF192 domain-containing protein [Candidatus Wildermuthbacteria bacterium]
MSKANVLAVSIAVILLGLFYVLSSSESSSGLKQNVPQATIQIGDAVLFVEVLDTPEQRQEGLSGRAELATGAGVLFIHEEPGQHFTRHLSYFFSPLERCSLCIGNKCGLGKRA